MNGTSVLFELLRPFSERIYSVKLTSIHDLSRLHGALLVGVKAGGRVAEVLVYDGEVRAARASDGHIVYGEDAVSVFARMLPAEALILEFKRRLVEWDSQLSVYVKGIDLQHRQFVRALNRGFEGLVEGDSRVVDEMLGFLEEYARFHFRSEEALLSRVGYPRLREHAGQHRMFVAKVSELRSLVAREPGAQIEVLAFTARWLLEHIRGSDREWGLWLARESRR